VSDVTVFHDAEKKLKELERRNPKVKFVLRQTSVEYTRSSTSPRSTR
jgi:hypothetical protein